MGQFFATHDWMTGRLGLGWPECSVYAVVYGYSKNGQGDFHASVGSLAALVGCSERTARRTLRKLCEKGLLICTDNSHEGDTWHYIAVAPPWMTPVRMAGEGGQSDRGTPVSVTPNNKYNNKKDSKGKSSQWNGAARASVPRGLTPVQQPEALEEPAWCRE